MPKIILYFLIVSRVFIGCKNQKNTQAILHLKSEDASIQNVKKSMKQVRLVIHTSVGDIKVRLFNDTPKHRDNFVKLVKQGYYDSTLFHRIINNFMIQGGDPDSKNASHEKKLGDSDLGYTVKAEIIPAKYFHKKGALAAARENDDINPNKESSACQFYIVQGKIQNDSLLEKNEKRINRQIIKKITDSILSLSNNKKIKADFERIKNIGATNNDSLQILQKKIDELVELPYQNYPKYKITEEQRRTYKKIGGTPHLDTHYTVFGEVYEGLDILDKIIINKTDKNDRPLQDIRMWINILK